MNQANPFITFLALSFACAFISLTVTKSKFFESFRDFFFNRSTAKTKSGRIFSFFYELISCPYCFSHWVSIAMVLIWKPRFTHCGINGLWILDYIVSIFVMVGLSSYLWGIFFRITHDKED